MITKNISQAERIQAYKVYHGLAADVECQADGSIVNIKGHAKSFNWVLEFDFELREVLGKEADQYLEDTFAHGNRRWIVMHT